MSLPTPLTPKCRAKFGSKGPSGALACNLNPEVYLETGRGPLKQGLDGGRRGECLGIAIDEPGDLEPERQPFILQHRK